MKSLLASTLGLVFLLCLAVSAAAKEEDTPLVAADKALHKEFAAAIPKDKFKTVDDLHKKWEEVLAGASKAILLDVRSHPEFDAFHIEGSSHIQSGNVSLIPRKIKEPVTEIWVFSRTEHHAKFVAGYLYRTGFKNVYAVVKAPDGTEGGLVGWVKRGHPVVNYFFGYADKNGIHYSPPPLKERNADNYLREFIGQRGEVCGK